MERTAYTSRTILVAIAVVIASDGAFLLLQSESTRLHEPSWVHLLGPAWKLGCVGRPKPTTYRTGIWPAGSEALKRQGALTSVGRTAGSSPLLRGTPRRQADAAGEGPTAMPLSRRAFR